MDSASFARLQTIVEQQQKILQRQDDRLDEIAKTLNTIAKYVVHQKHLEKQVDQMSANVQAHESDIRLITKDVNNIQHMHNARWWVLTTVAAVGAAIGGAFINFIF